MDHQQNVFVSHTKFTLLSTFKWGVKFIGHSGTTVHL